MIRNFTLFAFFILFSINVKSQITVYSNNNVGVKTSTTPTESMEVNGNVKASYFIGDGSRLTNLPSGGGSSQWTTTGSNIYFNNGNVGIGNTAPLSKLAVGSNSGGSTYTSFFFNNTNSTYNAPIKAQGSETSNRSFGMWGLIIINSGSSGIHYGLYGQAYANTPFSSGRTYGVHGQAGNATSGWNYGLYGALVGDNNGAGVYGVVPGYGDEDTGGKYAGYFRGNVYMSSNVSIGYKTASYTLDVNGIIRGTNVVPSDVRLKEDIKGVTGAMASIRNLNGVTYKLKEDGFVSSLSAKTIAKADTGTVSTANLSTAKHKENALYERNHIGFIAQDVQKVFPELVYEDKEGVLSVDYVSMIPILVESMKELNLKVEKLERENADLKRKLQLE